MKNNQNSGAVVRRLLRTIREFYPVMLPLTLVCIVVNAVVSSLPSIFMQNISQFPDGYDTYIEQGGTNVSGGQKQRLCIARALLKKPKVLIFDDSTSAVDTATEAKIRSALAQLGGMTKIIIAQRISSVMNTDKIVILEDGRIHAVGSHAELLASDPIYQEIYASQMRGGEADGQTAQQ